MSLHNLPPSSSKRRPVVLCILDGWGEGISSTTNAITEAVTPHWDKCRELYPHSLLSASAGDAGLPEGQMGNSEVGHMNIGAGRIVMQDLPRIDQAIAKGELAANPQLQKLIACLKETGGTCHLMGLVSPGGVHSHQAHLLPLIEILHAAGISVSVHAFLDGRDTPPKSAVTFIAKLMEDIAPYPRCKIATLCGRYYAMDRDRRWARVKKAYLALTEGQGEPSALPLDTIQKAYDRNITDEFIPPSVIGNYAGMQDNDAVLMANFRADRVREILAALGDKGFKDFVRPRTIRLAAMVGLCEYSDEHNRYMNSLFSPSKMDNILGEIVSAAGMQQLRLAETEKYAHVTFFFNGGREPPYVGEERLLVPSPKVATYDLQPEMSAKEITDRLVNAIEKKQFDLIIINYANGDMVGHSGILKAAVQAVETVDSCLGRLIETLLKANGTMLLTADHGNCEVMQDPITQEPHTAHTMNKVPLVLINGPKYTTRLRNGRLADLAPTVLELLGLSKPSEMTGCSLLGKNDIVEKEKIATFSSPM